jgi:hypothetical protein
MIRLVHGVDFSMVRAGLLRWATPMPVGWRGQTKSRVAVTFPFGCLPIELVPSGGWHLISADCLGARLQPAYSRFGHRGDRSWRCCPEGNELQVRTSSRPTGRAVLW